MIELNSDEEQSDIEMIEMVNEFETGPANNKFNCNNTRGQIIQNMMRKAGYLHLYNNT